MKIALKFLPVVALYMFISSCGNTAATDASAKADEIRKQVKESTPGSIPASGAGYMMTAKLDGKDWTATSLIPDEDQRSSYIRIAGEDGEGNSISFQLWKRGLSPGAKTAFSEDHAADVNIKDFSGFLGGRSGEVEITKMDDKWMEGKFQMTATSLQSDKKVEITEGKFRVGLVPGLR